MGTPSQTGVGGSVGFFKTGLLCVIALVVPELRDPPVSVFRVLGLQAWATTATQLRGKVFAKVKI